MPLAGYRDGVPCCSPASCPTSPRTQTRYQRQSLTRMRRALSRLSAISADFVRIQTTLPALDVITRSISPKPSPMRENALMRRKLPRIKTILYALSGAAFDKASMSSSSLRCLVELAAYLRQYSPFRGFIRVYSSFESFFSFCRPFSFSLSGRSMSSSRSQASLLT